MTEAHYIVHVVSVWHVRSQLVHFAAMSRTRLASTILRARGLRTRREFAETVKATEQTVYNWETGRTRPTHVDHIRGLAREGVPIADLLASDDDTSGGDKPIS